MQPVNKGDIVNRLSLLVVFGLVGCGIDWEKGQHPDRAIKVQIKNEYAESIFEVAYSIEHSAVDGGSANVENGQVMERTRLASGASLVSTQEIIAEESANITLYVNATSLGETRTFTIPVPNTSTFGTYRIVYDFDLAMGDFGVEHRWKKSTDVD